MLDPGPEHLKVLQSLATRNFCVGELLAQALLVKNADVTGLHKRPGNAPIFSPVF